MPKLSEILDVEKQRVSPESLRQIRLWTDGSFYRAYEWSAWLCTRYVRQFKVTRRHIKNIDTDVVFIGFPQSSFEKFRVEGSTVEQWEDKGILMTLPEELVHPDREDSTLSEEYQNWRATIPLAQKTEDGKVKEGQPKAGQPVSMTGIMRQILEFQVENHSPIECIIIPLICSPGHSYRIRTVVCRSVERIMA